MRRSRSATRVAREAVARYYAERGLPSSPSRIALTASTSEAYGWLFKLLTERGDRVLVPAPSYPLLAFLASLEDVELVPYPLAREEGWRVDRSAIEHAIDDRTKAIVLVHPNNPTGTLVRRDEAAALDALAARARARADRRRGVRRLPAGPARARSPPELRGRDGEALTFVLSGLSKVSRLPQLKLAWIAALGPEALVARPWSASR
jgi:alanine-synthesizing transaminase